MAMLLKISRLLINSQHTVRGKECISSKEIECEIINRASIIIKRSEVLNLFSVDAPKCL